MERVVALGVLLSGSICLSAGAVLMSRVFAQEQVSPDAVRDADTIRCDYVVSATIYAMEPIRLCGQFPTQTNIGNVDDIHVRKFKYALQDAGYQVTIRAIRLVSNPQYVREREVR
jgi:hypothetical protein